MYWIEVYFENGKTLRKESTNLNGSYKVLTRYNNGRNRLRVQRIVAGHDDVTTLDINKTSQLVF